MDAYYKDGIIKRSDLEEYLKYGHEGLSLIEANMQRCAKLINSFKQLSVAQTHVSQETIDIVPIIKNVISPTGILNISPSVSIQLDADEEVMVNVDPDLLSLILVNVISNILQHAFPQQTGNIFITVEKANGKLYLDIADDGIGISDEHIEQIFEPFYTTRRHQGYVGLGLHIVYVILTQALHGSIRVESSPNNGAHFKIELAEFNPYCIQKNESIEKNEQ
jgi:signal transduction histidine kinase